MQNHKKELELEQNNRWELESHEGELVENLQKKVDLMKKQMKKQQKHIRSQLFKSKMKPNQGLAEQKKAKSSAA